MKTVLEALTEARAIIANPAHWIQHWHASNAGGDEVNPDDEGAICFCGDGALVKASGATFQDGDLCTVDTPYDAASALLSDAVRDLTGGVSRSIAIINDGDCIVHGLTPHMAVMAAFDHAITAAAKA